MEGWRVVLDELEFRLLWRVVPPCARTFIVGELRSQRRQQRVITPRRRWYFASSPFLPIPCGMKIIGATRSR